MSSSSPKTISPTGWPADTRVRQDARLRRRIRMAGFVLLVERVVPALWPAIGAVGLYFAAALFGLFTVIPWIVQSLILAASITATVPAPLSDAPSPATQLSKCAPAMT